jgi:hypothetical protein
VVGPPVRGADERAAGRRLDHDLAALQRLFRRPFGDGDDHGVLGTVFSGVRVLRRKRPDLDPRQRAKPLDWIATLAVLAIGAWVLLLVVQGRMGGKAAVSAALVYAAFTYGGWDLWRFWRPAAWPFGPSLWRHEHVVKMLSAYGAVVSAFSGNVLVFLPAPWSQLWPTLIFQPMAAVWIVVLARQERRADPRRRERGGIGPASGF